MIVDIYLKDDAYNPVTAKIIGKTNENNATILKFHFEKELKEDYHFFLDVEKNDGFKTKSSEIEIIKDVAEFKVPNNFLDVVGILKIEPILYKDNIVKKYQTISFKIVDSINATDYISEEYPDIIAEILKIKNIVSFTGNGNKFLNDAGEYVEIDDPSYIEAKNVFFEDGTNFQEKLDNNSLKGEKGDVGPQGPKGDSFKYEDFTSEQLENLRGPIGPQGPQGIPGENGQQGIQGEIGPKGEQGPPGTNGEDGNDGENGATFIPNVDAEGNLSWTNDKELENPPAINIKGPQGPKGDTGDTPDLTGYATEEYVNNAISTSIKSALESDY